MENYVEVWYQMDAGDVNERKFVKRAGLKGQKFH